MISKAGYIYYMTMAPLLPCLVARLAPIVIFYRTIHIDDAIFCIINDVIIVLYILNVWDTDCPLGHENSKG